MAELSGVGRTGKVHPVGGAGCETPPTAGSHMPLIMWLRLPDSALLVLSCYESGAVGVIIGVLQLQGSQTGKIICFIMN